MPADTVSLSAIAAQQHVPKAEPNTVLPHSAGQAGGEAGSSAHPGTEAPTASLPFSPGSCQGPLRPPFHTLSQVPVLLSPPSEVPTVLANAG